MNHRNAFQAEVKLSSIRSQSPMYMRTMYLKGKEWLVVENYGIIARRFPTTEELNKACPYGMAIRTVNDDLSLTGEYSPALILGDRTEVVAMYELVRKSQEEANKARRQRMLERQAEEFGFYRAPVAPVAPMRIQSEPNTTFSYRAEGSKAEAIAAGIVVGAAAIVGLVAWASRR